MHYYSLLGLSHDTHSANKVKLDFPLSVTFLCPVYRSVLQESVSNLNTCQVNSVWGQNETITLAEVKFSQTSSYSMSFWQCSMGTCPWGWEHVPNLPMLSGLGNFVGNVFYHPLYTPSTWGIQWGLPLHKWDTHDTSGYSRTSPTCLHPC